MGEEYLETLCCAARMNKEVGSAMNGIDINLHYFKKLELRRFRQVPRNKLILLSLTLIEVCFLFKTTELVRHKLTMKLPPGTPMRLG